MRIKTKKAENRVEDVRRKVSRVEDVKERVSEGQGKVVLSLREFCIKEAKGCFGSPLYAYYSEAGVVSGGAEKVSIDGWRDSFRFEIDLPGIFDSINLCNHYFYTPDLAIPVRNKITTSSIIGFHLGFFPEKLGKAEDGQICFGAYEFEQLQDIAGYRREIPYLERLEVLLGEEIKAFAEKKGVSPEQVDDFFRLFSEGEIKRRVDKYNDKQREMVAGNLVQEVAGLCRLDKEVRILEERVLKATFSVAIEQDGSGYGVWSDSAVNRYYGLRREISGIRGQITEILRKAGSVKLEEHPAIDGEYAGFPAKVNPKDYLAYVGEVLAEVDGRIGRLDEHLREQKQGARRR